MEDWLFDTSYFYDHDYGSSEVKSKFQTIGPYVLHGDLNCEQRVVLYGGSTTSAIQGSTLSANLYHALTEATQKEVCILNGGCGGHNSWNEYLKLSRDLVTLRPTLTISFSGINDVWHFTHPKNTRVNIYPIQHIYPYCKDEFNGINVPPGNISHADYWIYLSKAMKNVADASNSKFIRFLQPCLGFSPYDYDLEDDLDADFHRRSIDSDDPYIPAVKVFYSKITSYIESSKDDSLISLSDVFAGRTRMFHDFRHPNNEGYRLIAKEMLPFIKKQVPTWFEGTQKLTTF